MAHALPTNMMDTCNGTFYCFGKWAYNVSNASFWTFGLLGFCIALMIATSRLGVTRSFGYASFVGMIGSIFFATLGFMPWFIASAFILTGIVGIASMIMSNK